MIDVNEIMAWDRVDPYYVWAAITDYSGMPARDGRWVPLLVESSTTDNTGSLMDKLTDEFEDQLLIPLKTRDVQRFTIQVEKTVLDTVLVTLNIRGARWELGLPFGSPTPTISFDGSFRPRSDHQIVGFIDYGCAFAHRQFRAWENGNITLRTRVLALWAQGDDAAVNRKAASRAALYPPSWVTPGDFGYGAEIKRDEDSSPSDSVEPSPAEHTKIEGLPTNLYMQQFEFNGSLDEEACYDYSGYQAIQTPVTHGTHMMDVATGYPNPLLPLGVNPGTPPKQEIVFVQLPRFFDGQQVSGLLRTYVLDAVRYILSCAKPNVPVTINLSYGAYAGPHDGCSILEMALDEVISKRRSEGGATDIVIAAGNGADAQTHVSTDLTEGSSVSYWWGNIPDNPTNQFTEIWIDGEDPAEPCDVRFTPPGVTPIEVDWVGLGECRNIDYQGQLVAMVIAPKKVCQSDRGRMVLLVVKPTSLSGGILAAPYGDWRLEVRNTGTSRAKVNAWIERDDPVFTSDSGPRQARFRKGDAVISRTLNSIAHGSEPIVVGGYVGGSFRQPDYSSIGPGRGDETVRNPSSANGAGKLGPEWLAVCEEGDALPGVAAAAVIGVERVRLPGTSVSAAVATRYVAEFREVNAQAASPVMPPNRMQTVRDNVENENVMPCVPYSGSSTGTGDQA